MCNACYQKNYWNSKGGHKNQKTIRYMHSQRFDGLRVNVLIRDGYKCNVCGMTDAEHKDTYQREITIDHIDGNGRYADKPNNTLDNLWTLCLKCHGRRDAIRHFITRGKRYEDSLLQELKLKGA